VSFKISHIVINGIALINLDGFAPASQWEELSVAPVSSASRSNTEERPDDLFLHPDHPVP
jgi:hypothetical protein